GRSRCRAAGTRAAAAAATACRTAWHARCSFRSSEASIEAAISMEERVMMRTRTALAALILAPALAAVPLTIARANHVRIEGTVESQPLPPAPTVIVPAGPAPASNPQAHEIRAPPLPPHVIYANKIEAE